MIKNQKGQQKTNRYYLVRDKENISVCQGFFLRTLGLSEIFVRKVVNFQMEGVVMSQATKDQTLLSRQYWTIN